MYNFVLNVNGGFFLDSGYITGYTEAIASFTYSKVGERYNIYFSIKFSWRDKLLAEMISDYFSVGKLYPVYSRDGALKSFYYRVNKIDDLAVVVNHYDNNQFLGEKRDRYLKWREMYLVKRGIINDVQMEVLASELSQMNPKNK